MNVIKSLHGKFVHEGRVNRLSAILADLVPPGSSLLDVGCGDGRIAANIASLRPDVSVHGIDVLVRDDALIPVSQFDGEVIPFPDSHFDVVMFVDVLHHTIDPMILLREAARVSRSIILLKDHNDNGFLSNPILRIMDWVGNKPHGVSLPYNYWKRRDWRVAFEKIGLRSESHSESLYLYSPPVDLICGRQLHFVAALSVDRARLS
jgi:SAM-dependent methyltransferase